MTTILLTGAAGNLGSQLDAATQRSNGRSQQISIRGLNGDFSTGLLNGREQVSTGFTLMMIDDANLNCA